MKNLFLLIICAISFSAFGQETQQKTAVEYNPDDPVRNTDQLLTVLKSDPCILTLALKDLYLDSITKADLQSPFSLGYTRKLDNAEAFDEDYIKLNCQKDSFLRWQKIKNNNYKLLNSINP